MMIEQEDLAPGWNSADQEKIDPEELWLDQDISPEELIQLDPLDITSEMIELAENPELSDPNLSELSSRQCSQRLWHLIMKMVRQRRREQPRRDLQMRLDEWMDERPEGVA